MDSILKYVSMIGVFHVVQCSKPLCLTPLISTNRLEEARQLAAVDANQFLGVKSYSGFLSANPKVDSCLFFWYFPAAGAIEQNADGQKPLVLWLNGGPSQSSLMGVFLQNGPFRIDDEDPLLIQNNSISWHRFFSMLYIDQPAGTGFSYTNAKEGFVRNMSELADQLYFVLKQFFQLFPWLQSTPFYIAGESYAGKYIPAIANTIVEAQQLNCTEVRINLQGLAMGNALTDPMNMLNYAEFAYQLGFLDDRERRHMESLEEAVRQGPMKDFFKLSQRIIDYFLEKTEYGVSVYNVLKASVDLGSFVDFVNQAHIKEALHVADMEFNHGNETVGAYLDADFGVSAMPWVVNVLEKGLRVMYFSGNVDFIVGYPLSVNGFRKMQWSGSEEYLGAERDVFRVNGDVAGFIKKAKNFVEIVVFNAGHSVCADQPLSAVKLMRMFVADRL